MNPIKDIESGVLASLLLQDTFARLEDEGISVRSDSRVEPISDIKVEDFSPQIRFKALQMQHVYVGFFCLENAVRELILQRLSERHGSGWWEAKVPGKIKDNVAKLKHKEEANRYLSTRSTSNIGYTTFGNLAQVIIANWDDFADLFPDQAWITSRFNDLEMCRNIIMHTNVLPDVEIARIDSIIRDWLSQVG
jgi:hypothetical protein